ncbi:hypothetical protein P5673_024122 [Acropora cervicornis]|uniref:Uncharacterized protein n=1 Tax=Acropora cervicornis TaxID=6130 RepID=A0AAD9Q470_ACRCE|nr:hypothetical protein P5673_024122 [Acropora cervicornis]
MPSAFLALLSLSSYRLKSRAVISSLTSNPSFKISLANVLEAKQIYWFICLSLSTETRSVSRVTFSFQEVKSEKQLDCKDFMKENRIALPMETVHHSGRFPQGARYDKGPIQLGTKSMAL